jgi:hypothetical protein
LLQQAVHGCVAPLDSEKRVFFQFDPKMIRKKLCGVAMVFFLRFFLLRIQVVHQRVVP